MSSKRRAENRTRRALHDGEPLPCAAAGPLIDALKAEGEWVAMVAVVKGCNGTAENWHERRKASAGGSRINPANLVACCQSCNGLIEDHPKAAHRAGLVVREGDPGFELLGRRNDR